MSLPGRPKGEYRSAQHEGSPVSAKAAAASAAVSAAGRRRVLRAALTGGLVVLARRGAGQSAPAAADASAASGVRVIALTARRFRFEPEEIALRVGEQVVVEIRSLDWIHGINLPSLGQRLDLLPGRVTRLALHPTQPGVIDFLCDNFCGEGHDQMSGRFVVSA
jgi:cytochrome c oxidase subunit 2